MTQSSKSAMLQHPNQLSQRSSDSSQSATSTELEANRILSIVNDYPNYLYAKHIPDNDVPLDIYTGTRGMRTTMSVQQFRADFMANIKINFSDTTSTEFLSHRHYQDMVIVSGMSLRNYAHFLCFLFDYYYFL